MIKARLIATSLFVLTLGSCSRGVSHEVSEAVWKDTFENWNITNATVILNNDDESNLADLTVKAESKTKLYYEMTLGEVILEAFAYEEDGKYYSIAMISGVTENYMRQEMSKEEFEAAPNGEPFSYIFTPYIADSFDLKNKYKDFTYDASKESYIGTIEISAKENSEVVEEGTVEIKFTNNKLTFLEASENYEGTKTSMTLKDIGSTIITIPTDFVDFNFSF